MTEPENHTLRLLREIRAAIQAMDTKLTTKIDHNQQQLNEQLDSLKRFAVGESVLGRYATAAFDQRLEAIEKRVAALEQGR